MKKIFLLLVMLLLVACNGTEATISPTNEPAVENVTVSTDTPTEEATAEVVEETVPEETAAEEATEVVSEEVEVVLLDVLDGNINNYCLDIAGGNQDIDPNNGLQAHTCYSYQGDLGTDQIFDTAGFVDNVLYMPIYDVCVEVASIEAGAEIGLATCDGSDLQSFLFADSGTISPASATELCFTAGSESRTGRSADHQIRDLTLEACSDELAAYQQWGSRTSLEDDISMLTGTAMATEEATP